MLNYECIAIILLFYERYLTSVFLFLVKINLGLQLIVGVNCPKPLIPLPQGLSLTSSKKNALRH